MCDFIEIENEIIKFNNMFSNGLNITVDNVENFNYFMRFIKQNVRNIELYNYLIERGLVNTDVFREALINIECKVEAACAELFLNGNEVLINEKLNRCKSMMSKEGELLNLNSESVVLIIGSGSIPITGIIYNDTFKSQIVCLDIDKRALDLAQKIVEKRGQASFFEFINQDASNIKVDENRITHIVVVGHIPNKNTVLDNISQKFSNGKMVLVRKSIGLYKLIYSDVDIHGLKNYSLVSCYNKDVGFPYESIVLRIQ